MTKFILAIAEFYRPQTDGFAHLRQKFSQFEHWIFYLIRHRAPFWFYSNLFTLTYYRKLYNDAHWQCKENLHYTKLMWIFQMLDLHQLMQNFLKQCAPNFISCEFAAIQTSLVQGGLVIPIKVTVQWQDEWAMEILRRKTEEVGYHLREMDQ